MKLPLIGLNAILLHEDCVRFTLELASNARPEVYIREGDGSWRNPGNDDHALGDAEVRDLVESRLTGEGDRLICELPRERVEFRRGRRGVDIKRTPRAEPELSSAEQKEVVQELLRGLDITGSSRNEKMKQAFHFTSAVLEALPRKLPREIRVLDLACGRSYLGFTLAWILRQRGVDVHLCGIDRSPELITTCKEIAMKVGLANVSFEVADLEAYSGEGRAYDIVICLHGCDVLSDEAIRIGVECGARCLFVAPCCQHEVRHQWSRHGMSWIARYGLLEQRLADVLTDGLRCLLLEALGFKVKVLRFTEPDVTPKNLLIQAVQGDGGPAPERLREVREFLKAFEILPRLARVLLPRLEG